MTGHRGKKVTHWVNVIDEASLPLGSYQVVDWNGLSLLIFNLNGEFYALKNLCTHEDQSLEGGEIAGEEIICPWHGAGFCIKTGAATRPPAFTGVKTFPVRLVDGKIQIAIDR